MESTKGFVLGAVAGGILGATEVPVNQIMQEIISGAQLKPVMTGIKSIGALGMGALLGTTALILAHELLELELLDAYGMHGNVIHICHFRADCSCCAGGDGVKTRLAEHFISTENITIRMTHAASVQALSAGFFMSEVCQVGLGAAIGGPVTREAGGKLILWVSVSNAVVLWMVEASSRMLGVSGRAGALLGVVGAAGVSMGRAAGVAVKSASWGGTIGTTAGLLVFRKWDIVNIGLQICVAYLFALTKLY